ncbi:amidohydrolase family protein [Halocatena marina]|uniref:amidohydrolase family protein n=1 Tax=Halocatena marina TaxID=2934937 RepID=UPI00200E9797|nr:amidohydrolase family protein [Halocatena marina]
MIDSHFHIWTQDNSTEVKRAERAAQLRREAEALGIEKICLIGEHGETIEECRAANRIVAKYVEEHPDLFHGWAVVNPRLGEAAVTEFRRAIEADGLIGLKHHSQWSKMPCSDPKMHPLAEAAVEMNAPLLAHVTHRREPALNERPHESQTEDALKLAQQFPDLTFISAHIGAGGDWERRIKNIQHQDNIYLDTSGTNCEAGQLEMAREYLGTDRLVFGTDTWLLPGVGKLEGADLLPQEKAEIAYRIETLIPETVPTKLDETTLEARIESARRRFLTAKEPCAETVVDVNAFVGNYPFSPLDASTTDLIALMDEKGVDKAIVTSIDSVMYRNCHSGNIELAEKIRGHEDRLIPFATINPTYPAWEQDLNQCLDELGMKGVKLLPAYHDYDLNDPGIVALLNHCADRDVPVTFVATLEDQRKRHPLINLREHDGIRRDFWADKQVDDLIDVLTTCPETDVIIADAWEHAFRIKEEVCTVQQSGVRLNNTVRSGETLFVLGDLFMFFTYQGSRIVEQIGVDHLVTGPQLPFKTFESYDNYANHLPVTDEERQQIRSGNILTLLR